MPKPRDRQNLFSYLMVWVFFSSPLYAMNHFPRFLPFQALEKGDVTQVCRSHWSIKPLHFSYIASDLSQFSISFWYVPYIPLQRENHLLSKGFFYSYFEPFSAHRHSTHMQRAQYMCVLGPWPPLLLQHKQQKRSTESPSLLLTTYSIRGWEHSSSVLLSASPSPLCHTSCFPLGPKRRKILVLSQALLTALRHLTGIRIAAQPRNSAHNSCISRTLCFSRWQRKDIWEEWRERDNNVYMYNAISWQFYIDFRK